MGSCDVAEHLAAGDGDHPAADLTQALDREEHVVVAHARDEEVVVVVRDRAGHRAALAGRGRGRSRARSCPARRGARCSRPSRRRPRRKRGTEPSIDRQLDGQVLGRDTLAEAMPIARTVATVAGRLDPEVRLGQRAARAGSTRRPRAGTRTRQLPRLAHRRRARGAGGSRARSSTNRMSASRPGAIDPRSWRMPKYSAPFTVAIWIATSGSIPSSIARRTTRSMCPSVTIVSGRTSSVTSRQWRGSTPSSVSTGASASTSLERRALAELDPHPGAQLRERVLARAWSRGTSRLRRRCMPAGGGRGRRRGSSGR